MPSVTHDGHSFMIDGRRIWLASGRVPYARLCRDEWAKRIHEAKLAGLNAIETPVMWNRHESRPGRFDFTGNNDLRHFVDLVGQAGLYCIISIGPYNASGWDFGGLPAFLRDTPAGTMLRTAVGNSGGAFLEAASKYITAVADQIRGWQVTSPGAGGPIVLLQLESGWTCGHEALANAYLGELTRYCREAGLNVPIVNSNNLWQSVEGQIDGWSGNSDMLETMRQLCAVRATHPRLVIDFAMGGNATWEREAAPPLDGATVERRLSKALGAGGQFNITTFCGGTNFGFSSGRLGSGVDHFATARADHACAIDEYGDRTGLFTAVRRVAHLASRFGRVFASFDQSYQPVVVKPADSAPAEAPRAKADARRHSPRAGQAPARCSVVHASGSQGGIAFVFHDGANAGETTSLLMPDGTALPVPASPGRVTWCLLGVNITSRGRLDYANISAFGSVGQSLVLFGPAGARAIVSVNGSPIEVNIGAGDHPVVVPHEVLTLVIVNDDLVDRTYLTDEGVFVGVRTLKPDGTPVPVTGAKSYTRIGADGVVRVMKVDQTPRRSHPHRATLHAWQHADVAEYVDGSSARYATIDAPADLSTLGCPNGYGWYRLRLDVAGTRRMTLQFPGSGDRLHVYAGGKSAGIVGVGAGAGDSCTLNVKPEAPIVVLADNLGRFADGANMGEGKGLLGAIYETRTLKAPRARIVEGKPVDVLGFRMPLWEVSEGDATSPERVTWTIPSRKRAPVIMSMAEPPDSALLLVNDQPLAYVDKSGPRQIVLSPDVLSKPSNLVQIAPLEHGAATSLLRSLASTVRFDECVGSVLDRGELAFAKWESPVATAFVSKGAVPKGHPVWWRTDLSVEGAGRSLQLDLAGMTKGQIYLNGTHVSRYFVAGPDFRPLPGQQRYLLPGSWLRAGPNDLMLFDEHGASPSHVRVSVHAE